MSKWIVAALGLEILALLALLTLALDLYAHDRVEQLGGVNIWGYRGPVMAQKRSNEVRLAVVGGSLAFGWGIAASETLAQALRQHAALALDRPGRPATIVTAVNLGALGLPIWQYAGRIEQFGDLRPDVICIYAGIGQDAAGALLPPSDSAVTALTGYVPMLPLVLEEKGTLLSVRGHTVAGPVVARAGHLLRRADAWTYRTVFAEESARTADDVSGLQAAIAAALTRAAAVIVMMPVPDTAEQHSAIQSALAQLDARHLGESRVRFVDLGRDPLLYDEELRLDGVNFSVAGHARAAQHVAPLVLELVMGRIARS